jgi:hypothetical protein
MRAIDRYAVRPIHAPRCIHLSVRVPSELA